MSKYYVMPMFPYPSGDSMHVGHASNYIINDFVARYKKMQGFDVIHPMGFDSFGLPTENYAIKTGKSARQATKDNVVNFKEQIKAINLQFDPEREFATSDPEYYKWTQWIFARLFEHGLAYKKDGLVNRCNGCQTVLANDQVVDGKCERCETIIIQKKHPQRYIKTTALANELIDDLDLIDRPEETKTIQKNWIGRSFGAEIDFTIEENGEKLGKVEENNLTITVFTTRPDTLYGVTALVLAPENQIIDHLLSSEKQKELEIFRNEVAKLTSIDRQSTERAKNGINSGIFVTHPLTNEQVPVWFADYVLMDYATGAVMMVPAHDERDREFAKRYEIGVKWVIYPHPPRPLSFREEELSNGIKNDHIYDGQDKGLIEFAKGLRKDGTEIEKIVWEGLRDRKFNNLKFRRQHPIGGYIADFYCDELKLIIEIDGSVHETQNQIIKDRYRDEDLQLKGLTIIRITNSEILENPNIIYEKINLHYSSPSLKERGPGGEDNPRSKGPGGEDNPRSKGPGGEDNPRTDSGYLINSAQFDGIDNITAKTKITEYLESTGCGRKKTTFRLRDRSVSRQRYRGSPIPVYYTFEENFKVPYYTSRDGFPESYGNRTQPDKPVITRHNAKVIIKHRSEDKYLLLHNETFGYHLVGGGIDAGETYLQAAIREAKEETPYENFKLLEEIPGEVHNDFYQPRKQENRYLIEHFVVLQLENDEYTETHLESHEEFAYHWMEPKEIGALLQYRNEQHGWYLHFDPSQITTHKWTDRYNAYNPHPDKSKWIPHLIPDEDLPVILPLDLPNYKPAGKSPLEDHPTFKYYSRQEQIGPVFEKDVKGIKIKVTPAVEPKKNILSQSTKSASVIIQHPHEDKFILLKHKKTNRVIFCGGGIDEGESLMEAGIREMTEETGYYDIAEQKIIGKNLMFDFYHSGKNINYLNNDNCIYIKLKSLNQATIKQEEYHKHDLIRVDKDEVMKTMKYGESHIFWWNRFINQEKDVEDVDNEFIKETNTKAYKITTYLRECDTLDTFMCSSFYFLRYLDPANTSQLISHEAAKNMPVDLYIGGKEHAVGHLIYSRFIYKFLQKYRYIETEAKEPFIKLIHQGMVHAADGRKFSKRRGNGINPLDVVKEHNTDTLRTYLAFMGPIELPKNWNPDGVAGVGRFLKRFEKMVEFVHDQSDTNITSIVHQTIKAVGEDMDNLKFNTAISKLMIATNAIYEKGQVDNVSLQNLIILLAPFAPETAQRMWTAIGQDGDVTKQARPTYNSEHIQSSTIELPIQINGKTKGSLSVSKDITQDEAVELVRQDEKMSKYLDGGIKKIIRVPGRICNIIINE